MRVMRKTQREKTLDVRTSLQGIAFVFICIMALLFVMEVLVVAIRFIAG